MAEETREIPRSEWRTFFDDFSRDLEGPLATVEVASEELGSQLEAERSTLTGITYDHGDDILVIGLDLQGGSSEDLEHIVYHPQKIYLAEAGDVTTFEIEDSEAVKTLVKLLPASSS
jgi:uncharacterized protein DUF5335